MRAEYLANYSSQSGKKLLAFILEGKNGFGSSLNTALTLYILSRQPGINRVFQIITYHTWPYTPLNDIFQDFAENATYPLLVIEQHQTDDSHYFAQQNRINFKLSPLGTKIIILGGSYPKLTTWNSNGFFKRQFNRLNHLVQISVAFIAINRIKTNLLLVTQHVP